MKKFIVLFCIAITISSNLFSQKKLEFGFYLGTSITSLSGVDGLAQSLTDVASQTTGKNFPITKAPRAFLFTGGGFVSYSLKHWLSVKAGMEYAPKGEKFSGECYLSTDFNFKSKVLTTETVMKVGYLDFPVSVQFSTRSKTKPGRTYGYINLGLSPAIKLFSTVDVSTQLVERGFDQEGTTSEPLSQSNTSGTLDGIKGFDLGMFCSVGVCYKSLFLDFKVDRGLTNIIENNSSGSAIKNTMFALSFGVKF